MSGESAAGTGDCRLGILLSGRGSNFRAIADAIGKGEIPGATIAVVISNHAEAEGLRYAETLGLPALALDRARYEKRALFDQALTDTLKQYQTDLIVLAGYDRIIGAPLLSGWPGRILNIHPSLLPAYGGKGMLGMAVHRAVLSNQEAESGCSVHLVTDVVDGGEVLGQSRVPVHPEDTPEILAERILKEEHCLYPQVIRAFIHRHFLFGSDIQEEVSSL